MDLGADSTGRRRQTTKAGFPTRAAASKALRELTKTLASDVQITETTVSDYLATWLLSKHSLRPTTRAMYEDLARLYITPHIGGVQLVELRAHHLDRMYVAISIGVRGKALSPATIRRIHAVLRSALNSAVRRRLLPYNPADHIELAPENPKRPKPWTAEECLHFLAAIREDRLYPLYRLYLFTGLRRGEGLGLRWEDVDLDEKALWVSEQITEVSGKATVGSPKTRRSVRRVALDETTVQMLREHHEAQLAEREAWRLPAAPHGRVFTREDGTSYRPEYVTKHFGALIRSTGMRQVRLHDLRHTSASLALKAGVPMKVVSDRLGHSTIAVTANLYTHVYDDVAHDGADRIAALLADKPATDVSEM
ncbi:tyrosine-type recombinase/integrase [Quadrisphaera oryzae]|uniref:tyrosine-type recombinase/integrase n=1 Tax=Quadrisphaera TaxID=317661 RepID=UPI0016462B64|nr:site-specific integrase [Quadrisphaera sp. RL12-1S]